MELTSKLPGYGASIFSVMSGLAVKHQAINLSQGFPEFNPPIELQEAVADAMRKGRNQYAPMPGIPELRELLALRINEWRSVSVNPETEITVVPGATVGLYVALTALVRPGDEVIIVEPGYDSYAPVIELNGGVVKRANLKVDALQRGESPWPWEEVKSLLSSKTRLVIINTPHNPLGCIMEADDWKHLVDILKDSEAMVLSDEVYEHMVLDGKQHISVAQIPELAHKAVAVSSFGKTFHATGWKLGYLCAPSYISVELRKVFQFLAFAANTPMQVGAYQFLLENPDYEFTVAQLMQQKRDAFLKQLTNPNIEWLPCQGAYFLVADIGKIATKSDADFAVDLTVENGLASIPLSAFSKLPLPGTYLRFCFAKNDDTLHKAAQIINQLTGLINP